LPPLTKTEQAILDTLKTHKRYTATMVGGQGPHGGRKSSGVREYLACRKLIDRGLVEFVKTDREMLPERGYTIHLYDITIAQKD